MHTNTKLKVKVTFLLLLIFLLRIEIGGLQLVKFNLMSIEPFEFFYLGNPRII